jgi:hypothetical protein
VSRRQLTTRAVTKENIVEMVNREVIPYIRQTTPGTAVMGSVSVDTLFILGTILEILDAAGILVDETTP